MALRREQLYMVKAQGPQDTTTVLAANQYFGGSPVEIASAGVKLLKPSADGNADVRKFIGVAVNSWTEDNKYGHLTPYISGPAVLVLYDGAATPFIAGPGTYYGPGKDNVLGTEVGGPYGLGTGLTIGEGQPYLDVAGWVVGSEVSVTDDGLYMPAANPNYSVGIIKSVVGASTAPVLVEIQFFGGVSQVPA